MCADKQGENDSFMLTLVVENNIETSASRLYLVMFNSADKSSVDH